MPDNPFLLYTVLIRRPTKAAGASHYPIDTYRIHARSVVQAAQDAQTEWELNNSQRLPVGNILLVAHHDYLKTF